MSTQDNYNYTVVRQFAVMSVVWASYAIVFFSTVFKRRTPHLYVAIWLFGAGCSALSCLLQRTPPDINRHIEG